VVGGSIIPLLTLGVPGSPAAAILLGGLIIHGLFPGQELFTTHARVTYTFMIAMIGASFSVLVIGVAGSRLWGRLTKVPIQYLTPVVIALCVIGSYATRNNPADVIVMAGVGLAMFAASKVGFEPAPVVIGLVLGDLAETGFCSAGCSGGQRLCVDLFFSQAHPADHGRPDACLSGLDRRLTSTG